MDADRSSSRRAPGGGAWLLEERLTRRVLRVFDDVYNELGGGYLESVYSAALEIAFRDAGLPAVREAALPVRFRGALVGEFRADFVVAARVIVEVKAGRALDEAHAAQLLNYLRASNIALRASNIAVGLLLHFGAEPRFRRFVHQTH